MAKFSPFEVNVPHLAYTLLGGFVVLFGLFSLVIKERLYIGEAPIATIFGIIIGPYVGGVFNPRDWGGLSEHVTDEITLEVTRVVIALGVFAVGVELPKVGQMWIELMCSGVYEEEMAFFDLPPRTLHGLRLDDIGTPYVGFDPRTGFPVLLGHRSLCHPNGSDPRSSRSRRKVCRQTRPRPYPSLAVCRKWEQRRRCLSFPLHWSLPYIGREPGPRCRRMVLRYMVGFRKGLADNRLYEVALGIVLGALLGYAARKTMKFCEQKRLIDRQSYVAQYVSLAILSIGESMRDLADIRHNDFTWK
jgi:hypothetical protein